MRPTMASAEASVVCRSAAAMEQRYPGRKFTPDGHMVGSIWRSDRGRAFRPDAVAAIASRP